MDSPGPSSSPIRADAIAVPHGDRFAVDDPHYEACLEAHRTAVAERAPGYLDPGSGLYVLTAAYLLDRGWCCDRGCRHCPYVGATIDDEATDRASQEESKR